MKGLILAIPLLGSLAFGQTVTTNCTEFLGNVRCRSSNNWTGQTEITNCNTFLGNTRCTSNGIWGNTLILPPLVRSNDQLNRQLDGLRRSLETRSMIDRRRKEEKRNQSWKWVEDADELSY